MAAGTGSTQDGTRQCPAHSTEGPLTEVLLTDGGGEDSCGEMMGFLYAISGWTLFSRSVLCSQHCWGFRVFRLCFAFISFFLWVYSSPAPTISLIPYIIINKSASGSESLSDHCFKHTPQITAGPVFTNQFFSFICFLLSLQLTEDFLLHGLTS